MNDQRTTNLILTPVQLTATIEALHDAVLRRIGWSVSPSQTAWRDKLTIEVAQEVINNLISSYTTAMMVYGEEDFAKLDEFVEAFEFSPEIWDLLATFTKATSWDEVPFHAWHQDGCTLCEKLPRMP